LKLSAASEGVCALCRIQMLHGLADRKTDLQDVIPQHRSIKVSNAPAMKIKVATHLIRNMYRLQLETYYMSFTIQMAFLLR
jgi:hypothetical protein